MAGKSSRLDKAPGAAPSLIQATPSVATCRSCPRAAMLYVCRFLCFSHYHFSPTQLTYALDPSQKAFTNLIFFLFKQVFQWQQNNPGIWPFHCHIAWHLSGGLYANIMERPADIKNLLIPSTAYQNCRDWADYSGGDLLPQIDSGL